MKHRIEAKYEQSDEDLGVVMRILGFLIVTGFSLWGIVEVFVMPFIRLFT